MSFSNAHWAKTEELLQCSQGHCWLDQGWRSENHLNSGKPICISGLSATAENFLSKFLPFLHHSNRHLKKPRHLKKNPKHYEWPQIKDPGLQCRQGEWSLSNTGYQECSYTKMHVKRISRRYPMDRYCDMGKTLAGNLSWSASVASSITFKEDSKLVQNQLVSTSAIEVRQHWSVIKLSHIAPEPEQFWDKSVHLNLICEPKLEPFFVGTHILDWHTIRLGGECLLTAKLDAISRVYFASHSHLHLTTYELHMPVHSQGRSNPTVTTIQALVPYYSVGV